MRTHSAAAQAARVMVWTAPFAAGIAGAKGWLSEGPMAIAEVSAGILVWYFWLFVILYDSPDKETSDGGN
tara:strand:- start:2173 stop:2382 length:210 start_codon:yes stop_codon:yes gene_type:complete